MAMQSYMPCLYRAHAVPCAVVRAIVPCAALYSTSACPGPDIVVLLITAVPLGKAPVLGSRRC